MSIIRLANSSRNRNGILEAAIGAYRNRDAHKEIVRHTRGLKGAKAEVELYELVQ